MAKNGVTFASILSIVFSAGLVGADHAHDILPVLVFDCGAGLPVRDG